MWKSFYFTLLFLIERIYELERRQKGRKKMPVDVGEIVEKWERDF